MTYVPTSSDTAVRVLRVLVFVTVIVTRGSTAPEASVTVPVRVANVDCAGAGGGTNAKIAARNSKEIHNLNVAMRMTSPTFTKRGNARGLEWTAQAMPRAVFQTGQR